MRASTLLAAIVAAALLASSVYAATVCVAPASGKDYYALTAAQNCAPVKACREELCTCNGLPTSCTTTFFNVSRCTVGFACLRSFIDCINVAAPSHVATGGAICDSWGATITNLRTSFAAGTDNNWVGKDVYKACAYQACKKINNVNCSDASLFMCPRPVGAPTATPTPLTAIQTASPEKQKANVTVGASFPGNFDELFAPANAAALESFCDTVSLALATKIGLPAGSYQRVCTKGSLSVALIVETEADDTSLQDTIVNNAANVNEDADTTWIADLQTAIDTSCPTCSVTIEAPIVATAVVVEETPEPAPNTDVEQTCGSGCIAGVIVGVAVLVIIVISVVKIVVKKVSKGTEKTPASHEPTSGV